jgi:transposase
MPLVTSAVAGHVCPGRACPAGAVFLHVLIAETGWVTERLRVREIDDDEGRHLVRIVRRGTGSVVTWRRAQMVLLSAQGMDVPAIARVAFTSDDRVRDVIRNFNADGFGSLYPKYRGGHPPKFTLPQRREIKKIAKSKPGEHDLPFSAWSLPKLAEFLVAEGVIDDISHEGLRMLLREEGVTFQRIKTWKALQGPGLRGEEGPGGAPVRDRRRRRGPRRRRAGGDLLHG